MSVMALILSCRLGEFMRDRWRKLCVCTFFYSLAPSSELGVSVLLLNSVFHQDPSESRKQSQTKCCNFHWHLGDQLVGFDYG